MHLSRRLAGLVAACAAGLAATALVAEPASAHGALTNPVSRAAACGAETRVTRSAACAAVLAAAGTRKFDWDDVRVAGVAGNDRGMIPDGRLCSGGIDEYRGLDQPRVDWPTTTLVAGAVVTFTYRATIPHTGTFRIFLTRQGYDPTRPLSWDDLDPGPVLTARDPVLRGGAYTMASRLPGDRTGRHLLYTIWRNASTPDTYYSCSDVFFRAEELAPASAAGSAPTSGGPSGTAPVPGPDGGVGGAAGARALPSVVPIAAASERRLLPVGLVGGGLLFVVGALAAVAAVRRRAG